RPLSRRFPSRHGRSGLHARAHGDLHRDRLAVAHFELGRYEPRRNTRTACDGLPDFLRRAGDIHFALDGTASRRFFLHAHVVSLGLDLITTPAWTRSGTDRKARRAISWLR